MIFRHVNDFNFTLNNQGNALQTDISIDSEYQITNHVFPDFVFQTKGYFENLSFDVVIRTINF